VRGRSSGRQRAIVGLSSLTWYQSKNGDAMNTIAKVTLLVFVLFFLALLLAGLWMQ
jgi:hypothetical protein